MLLEHFRNQLKARLDSGTAFHASEEQGTLEAIKSWWDHYKYWESIDTFLDAFKEGRMTIRQAPLSLMYGTYQGQSSTAAFGANHASSTDRVEYPEHRYRVGIDSLKERMNPASFGLFQGERLKYLHGLHDLSGSLLTPTIAKISTQLRWKDQSLEDSKLNSWINIFMPMAKPEDMALFNQLNFMAKQVRAQRPLLYTRVQEMRRRMSRIKLAEAADIGAGLRNIAPSGQDPKFRYGLKSDPDPATGRLTGVDHVRAQNALNYPSILPQPPARISPPASLLSAAAAAAAGPGPPGSSAAPPPPPPGAKTTNTNEIVICYREHAGFRFPIFATWDKRAKAFICMAGEASSKLIVDGRIPDVWANTRQH